MLEKLEKSRESAAQGMYRVVEDMVFVDNIFHELQDYENKMY